MLTFAMLAALFLWAVTFVTVAPLDCRLATGRGPANATTLRDFYRQTNALSGDPTLNGTAMVLA